MDAPTIKRFMSKIDRSEDCWIWTASVDKRSGYGWFKFRNKMCRAHRFSWLLFHGKIKDKLCVLHKCDNPPCVNPKHLFLGTHRDNMLDMAMKGRATRLQKNKTHCLRGHEFDVTNTKIMESGWRYCRKCAVIREKKYRDRKKR